MQPTAILYPVFVQVALTFVLQIWMGRERVGALRRGEVKVPDIALGQRAWPTRATQVANAFHNQLELPLLFYVLVAFALITSRVDGPLVVMAWLFVGLRLVHAYHSHDAQLGPPSLLCVCPGLARPDGDVGLFRR